MAHRQVRSHAVAVAGSVLSLVLIASCSSSSAHTDTQLVGLAERVVDQTNAVLPEHLVTCCANVPAGRTMFKAVDEAAGVRHIGTLGDRSCAAKVYATSGDVDALIRRLRNVEGRVWQGQRRVDGRRVRILSQVDTDFEIHAAVIDSEGSDPPVLAIYSCE
jgi:hypothetical protein